MTAKENELTEELFASRILLDYARLRHECALLTILKHKAERSKNTSVAEIKISPDKENSTEIPFTTKIPKVAAALVELSNRVNGDVFTRRDLLHQLNEFPESSVDVVLRESIGTVLNRIVHGKYQFIH